MRALLLPGGGARGILQLGLISAYLEHNSYDSLYCTSVGALNGILVHQGELDKLIDLWKNIRNSDVYSWNLWNVFGPSACLFSSKPLGKLINKYVDVDKLKANPRPMYVSATCINPIKAETKQIPTDNTTSGF